MKSTLEILEKIKSQKIDNLSYTNNRKEEMPKEIGECETLEALIWSNNQTKKIPSEICELKNLKYLNLDNNHLKTLPKEIGRLTNLRQLSLNNNYIEDLPLEIANLTNLQELSVDSNALKLIPEELIKLKNLRVLSFKGNKISTLPENISKLINLKTLVLSNNNLRSFPQELEDLANLEELFVFENPVDIPEEILSDWQNPKKILNYYFKSKGGKPLNQAKIVVIGESRVGKTSLVKRIKSKVFDKNENSTHGIEIIPYSMNINNQEIDLRIWDFGGQEIMHSTHQFFFTNRTLYLLVLNSRENQNEQRAEYWLTKIKSLARDSPVLLVYNKLDEVESKGELGEFVKDYALQDKYKDIIKGEFGVCCDTEKKQYDSHFETLLGGIKKEVGNLKGLEKLFPENWFVIKKQLENMKEDFIPYSEYVDRCVDANITSIIDQRTLIEFLHDLGVVLSFIKDLRLNDTQVRNPLWVTQGVYAIIESKKLKDNSGILDIKMLENILDQKSHPPNKHIFIIDIMEKFELCYPIKTNEKYLIPGSLPAEQPQLKENNDVLGFEYEYETYFQSIVSRFIVKMHKNIHENLVWLNGVVLKQDENEAIIKADKQAKTITISISGNKSTRKDFMSEIRNKFDEIHGEFSMKIDEKVPIPGHPGYYEDFNHLEILDQKGIKETIPRGLAVGFKVSVLLNGVETIESRDLRKSKRLKKRKNIMNLTYLIEERKLNDEISTLEIKSVEGERKEISLEGEVNGLFKSVRVFICLSFIPFIFLILYFILKVDEKGFDNALTVDGLGSTLSILTLIAASYLGLFKKVEKSENEYDSELENVYEPRLKSQIRKITFWRKSYDPEDLRTISQEISRKRLKLESIRRKIGN